MKSATISAASSSAGVPGFILKTFDIISNEAYKDICSWNEEGNAITIKQLDQFTNIVLPKHFKHRNLPSFIRQLNMYGFHKTVVDSNVHDFTHPSFQRGRKDLLVHIKRKSSNPTKSAAYVAQRRESDQILNELAHLRKKSEAMESRLHRMETENTLVKMDNANLWSQLNSSRETQHMMQGKLQKLLMFMYSLYIQNSKRNHQKRLGASENIDVATAADDDAFDSGGPMTGDEFRDTVRYLCMNLPGAPRLESSSSSTDVQPMETRSKRQKVNNNNADEQTDEMPSPRITMVDEPILATHKTFPSIDQLPDSPPSDDLNVNQYVGDLEAASQNCLKQLGTFETSLLDQYDAADLDSLLDTIDAPGSSNTSTV